MRCCSLTRQSVVIIFRGNDLDGGAVKLYCWDTEQPVERVLESGLNWETREKGGGFQFHWGDKRKLF